MGKRWRKYTNGPYRLGQLNGQAVCVWRERGARHRIRLAATTESEGRSALDSYVKDRARLVKGSLRTIGELYAAYQHDRELDGKLIAAFKDSWKALGPRFGLLTPDDIDADLCRRYASERFLAGRSQGTVWTELTRLKSCLNWAAKRGMIPNTPYVWVPSKPEPKSRVLSRTEVLRLLDGCVMPHVRLFVILALATGGRSAALLELTWERVDFDAGTINLRAKQVINPLTKAVRKQRAMVPMNNLARAALSEAKSGALTGHVIEWDGQPIKKIRKGFCEAVRRAKLGSDVTPHVLRHTTASWMETEGIPMSQISRFLGHRDENTTRNIYAKPSPELLTAASKVVDLTERKKVRRT